MEGLGLVDLEAARPGAVGRVHEAHTQQLVVVVPGPVEDHAGAGQRGDVAVWVIGALEAVTAMTGGLDVVSVLFLFS